MPSRGGWAHSRGLNRRFPRLFIAAVAGLALSGGVAAPAARVAIDPARVVILANANDPGSLRLAEHYVDVRQVPRANVIALPLPAGETTDWPTFVAVLWEPLLERLIRDGWLDAIRMDLTDEVGRRKYAVNAHRIEALVVCRGVPLRIADDRELYRENPPLTRHGEFQTNQGSVDGELALLPRPNHPINAFVPNPLFQNDRPGRNEQEQVVRVSRLDGPTLEAAWALVDRAVEAERQGLLGRAYVDLSNYDPVGNRWLEAAAAQLRDLGFDTDIDRAPEIMPAEARVDAPVLYFGWYTGDLAGAFALPGLRFPPGAIALHIHSYSASTLRSETSGWTAPLVARGVTATVGNVFEPYLQLTHRPNLLVRALARGATWVDAGFYALPALSWQQILIGDPLYRPFARSIDDQLAHSRELPSRLAAYAVSRKANLLERAHRDDEALALLRDTQQSLPTLAGAVALADRLAARHDTHAADAALRAFVDAKTFAPDEWALARTVASRLTTDGDSAAAVAVWRTLVKDLPADVRARWLQDAIKAARAAGDTVQADTWAEEAERLSPQ